MMKELAIEFNVSLNASKKLQKSTAIQTRLMKNSKRFLRINLSSVITMLINLVCCWENVFIVTNIRNIGRNLIKHHYLEQWFLQLKTQITILHREFLKILKKNSGEYHDLYFKSNTLLQADTFKNFNKFYLNIYEPDHHNFFQLQDYYNERAAFKKINIELQLLADIDMLLILKRELEEENATLSIDMQKLIINEWIIMIKISNHPI